MSDKCQDKNPEPTVNREQAIMDAAEELFLEMGYNLATTTMIAKKAGGPHATLPEHYRTKEHIFMTVLEKTLEEFVLSFRPVMSKDEPFWETFEKGISTHFDFLVAHPRFVPFLYDTLLHNPELVGRLKEKFAPVVRKVLSFHAAMIREEAAAGRISMVDPVQLLTDIVTFNMSTFLLLPVARNLAGAAGMPCAERFLEARKAEIVAIAKSRLYGKLQ